MTWVNVTIHDFLLPIEIDYLGLASDGGDKVLKRENEEGQYLSWRNREVSIFCT